MTSKERIIRILDRQPVDRIGIFEHFWPDTFTEYTKKGKVKEEESFDEHFNLDISLASAFNLVLDMDFEPVVVAEDEDTVTMKDGNGATLKRHKHHDTTPEHVDFSVKSREDWDKVKHMLTPDPKRINFKGYRKAKSEAAKNGRFFAMATILPFECMHPVCGHEEMLVGMLMDPDWILDMASTYTDMIIEMQKILFEQEGLPDGIWYYEDLGYKDKPFMSPELFNKLLCPGYKRTFDYAHSLGLKVIVHSCGFVEPLLPYLIEAGMDCLQVIEVKAGMDLLRIQMNHGGFPLNPRPERHHHRGYRVLYPNPLRCPIAT